MSPKNSPVSMVVSPGFVNIKLSSKYSTRRPRSSRFFITLLKKLGRKICSIERSSCGSRIKSRVTNRCTYVLLAVVLTAALVCLSLSHTSGGCSDHPYRKPQPHVSPYTLLDHYEPYERTHLDPGDENTLIDLRDFSFHMNDPVCNSSSPLYVVLVHSCPDHETHRRAIRSTWGHKAHVVFLLGESNSTVLQEALDRENDAYHDLVQGSFLDSYRNLTYKHVMGLKWVTYHCLRARYVLKVDDDVFVNTPFLEEFLTHEVSPAGARRLIMFNLFPDGMVIRYRFKWRVTYREYAGSRYPDYCSGYAILYSPDAAFQLYREAQRTNYFWIDDVHVTGIVRGKINYAITSINDLTIHEDYAQKMMDNGYMEDFLFCMTSATHFDKMWNLVNSTRSAN